MRRAVLSIALVLGATALVLWFSGGADLLQGWAAEGQRRFQNAMAAALRALRAAEPGALAALWGVAFAYGFFHAVGPGHGKLLLGVYAAGTHVPLRRMMVIGLASAMAQATTAVLLVYGGVTLFRLSRAQIETVSDAWLGPASAIAVALIGCWLIWRGARAMLRQSTLLPAPATAMAAAGGGRHADARAAPCADCGHHHVPDAAATARIGSFGEAAALVAAIGLRPCTGALFLLILTWRMDLGWQGVAGAYAMGLGTASVTVAIVALSVMARDGALMWSERIGVMARALPVIELAAGTVVVVVALGLLGAGF